MLEHAETANRYLESLRASCEALNHQIDRSRETVASSPELLKQLDERLAASILKPASGRAPARDARAD
jgi:hypothetical protein